MKRKRAALPITDKKSAGKRTFFSFQSNAGTALSKNKRRREGCAVYYQSDVQGSIGADIRRSE